MTAEQLTRPAALAAVDELHAVLDRVALQPSNGLTVAEHTTLIAELARAESRLAAWQLRALAAADARAVHRGSGMSGTDAWLAGTTRTDLRDAARTVHLARDLQTCTATQESLGAGEIQAEHARAIAGALAKLPGRLSAEQRSVVEGTLVAKAKTMSPHELRRHARRALAAVEPDEALVDAHEDALLRQEEDHALDACALVMFDNPDGTVTGRFTTTRLAGTILQRILDTMTAPRRAKLGAPFAQAGPTPAREDPRHQRGLAFTQLLEHLPTDHLHPKTAATVVVNLSLEVLRGAITAAGLDTGNTISASQARRLACGAGIIPTVLNGDSLPLDLGRTHRLFSDTQRLALGQRHQTCAADGCQRPFAWCELHHLQPWNRGGKTDLNQAVPLCSFHHHRVHDPTYQHTRQPDGRIYFRLRT